MIKIDQILQQVRTELGSDFIAVDVIGTDGISIATLSNRPERDDTAGAARTAMVNKLAQKVSDKLNGGAVEDILTTTDRVYVLTRSIGDGSYTVGLTVTRDAILGSARMIMNEYAPQIWDAIPQ